jgi:thiamine biosynthesis lipoprotein
MIRRCQPLLGTFIELTLDGGTDRSLHKEAGKAFDLIGSIQRMMGFHDPESDVSRLNQCAHIAPLRVHPWTWQVIKKAVSLSETTEGAFDITIAPQLVKWGYLPRHPSVRVLAEAGLWKDIELLPDCHVRFHRPLQIDLGGIAKGFAVDKAIEWIATLGIDQATVNAGGDLRVHGAQNQALVIRDPVEPQTRHHPAVMLRPAVATSAAYFAKKRVGLSRVSPIVHPHNGKPLRSNVSVSVFAPTCMEADALTKAVLLAPQPVWNRVLREHDSLALFLTTKGEQILFPA